MSEDVTVDQTGADGWTELGTWTFAAGGDQWVALYDADGVTVASDQHIVADAIRLTRLDLPKGDDDDDATSGDDDDSSAADDDDATDDDDDSAGDDDDTTLSPPDPDGWGVDDAGCACAGEGSDAALVPLLFLGGLGLGRRRRIIR